MNITPSVLVKQAREALDRWPFIADIETRYGLPRWLLLAVGSRETNLDVKYTEGAVGDHGFGHGVWQKDSRFHGIPAGFDRNPQLQAETAAAHLAGLYAAFPHNENAAVASYNAGIGSVRKAMQAGKHPDAATTGKDYSRDVLERRAVLDRAIDHQPHPTPTFDPEDFMLPIATNPTNGRYWVLTGPDGGIAAFEADGSPSNVFFGSLPDHPEYGAGAGHPNGPAVNIAFWPDGQGGEGYVIYCDDRAEDGLVRPYHFDATTRKAA